MAGTPSSRRTTATAGCAVSRHILGQAEPETAEQMAGGQSRSKIGRNGEYRPDQKYIVLQSIHLDGAVLVPLVLLAMHAGAAILQEYLLFMMARVQPACHQYHCHSDCSVFYCAQAARQSIDCCIASRDGGRILAFLCDPPV